jgi:hypothetical protein
LHGKLAPDDFDHSAKDVNRRGLGDGRLCLALRLGLVVPERGEVLDLRRHAGEVEALRVLAVGSVEEGKDSRSKRYNCRVPAFAVSRFGQKRCDGVLENL